MTERYSQWAKYYDLMSSAELTDKEMAFFEWVFEKYGKGKDTKILDVTCGTGRHVFPLLEKGYEVTANDLSLDMLAVAREKAKERSLAVDFHNLDMRGLEWESEFDAVLTINSAFSYMLEDEDAEKAIGCFHRAIRPGGILILDVQNFLSLFEKFKKVIEKTIEADGIKIERKSTHYIEDELKCIWRHEEDDKIYLGDVVDHLREDHILRMYNYHELNRILINAGFTKIMCFGDFDDRQVAEKTANRLIFVAIK